MVKATSQRWSQFLGVSLRPWSGHAPLALILRGLIHVVIFGIIVVALFRLINGEAGVMTSQDASVIRGLIIPMLVVFIFFVFLGAARVVLGALDFLPRRQVEGVVLSVRERKVGDFLPTLVQRSIFERNPNNLDRRRVRTEIVLQTQTGEHQWTVRNRQVERDLVVGARVELTVSPLVGYVAGVRELSHS